MKTSFMMLAEWIRLIALWTLLLATALPGRVVGQDFNVRIGPPTAEERDKANKEILNKLPSDQAAAYLMHQRAWDSVTGTLEWGLTLALPVGVVAVVLTFRHRRHKLNCELMRAMIEKGLPVPPELLAPPTPAVSVHKDLRRGLVWLALGLGLAFALVRIFTETGTSLWTLGLIPALIGAAYLTCWAVGLLQQQRFNTLWAGAVLVTLGTGAVLAFSSSENIPVGDKSLDDFANLGLLPVALGGALLFSPLAKGLADINSASLWPGVMWITMSAGALLVFHLCHLATWRFWLIPLAIGLTYVAYWYFVRKAEHGKPSPG